MSLYIRMRGILIVLLLTISALANFALASDTFENEQIKLRMKARTPQQMAAFYEARGFPAAMIEKLNKVCFFTIGIKNKTRGILWHELASWKFTSAGKTIQRIDRQHWTSLWQAMAIPMASQSTFRWTLMPERLDFHPEESEGGNITLPRGPLTYDIEAFFLTGADKSGPAIKVIFTDIHCAEDEAGESP